MSVHYTAHCPVLRAVVDSAGGLRRGGTFVAADSNLVLYTQVRSIHVFSLFPSPIARTRHPGKHGLLLLSPPPMRIFDHSWAARLVPALLKGH